MKKPSDRTLDDWSRKVCHLLYKERCGICGRSGTLEWHHIVHKRCWILRWDWRNGFLVHSSIENTCHAFSDTLVGGEKVREKIGEKRYEYLMALEPIMKKDHLVMNGMSDNEFRAEKLAELKEKYDNLVKEGDV